MSDAAFGFGFFSAFHLHLDAFTQIVGWIHNDFRIFLQAIEHFQLGTEVAPDTYFLPVNAIVVRDRDDLGTLSAKNKCIRRHNDWRIIIRQ